MHLADQKLMIITILQGAKSKASPHLKNELDYVSQLVADDKLDSMELVFRRVNLHLARFEQMPEAQSVINFLKQHGLYRMLYRHPKYKGIDLQEDDILRNLLRNGFIGVGISVLFIVAFVSCISFTAPFIITAAATCFFIGASIYLTGMLYAVINGILTAHFNLPYLLLGNRSQHTSLLRTNDKIAQGIVWGIAEGLGPVLIATMAFIVGSALTAFIAPVATYLLPLLMLTMPLIAIGADFFARAKAQEYCKSGTLEVGKNSYQTNAIDIMCPTDEQKAAWMANEDRNIFGLTRVPFVALVGLVIVSTLGAFSPTIFISSSLAAVILPATFSGAAVITLLSLGLYAYLNRERHLDDRYHLNFEDNAINYELYLDEDMEYVRRVFNSRKSPTAFETGRSTQASPKHYAPLFGKNATQIPEAHPVTHLSP